MKAEGNDIKVTWTPLADTYVPEDLREQFMKEAEESRWRPANGEHPMSPGLALKEVIPQLVNALGLRGVRFSHVAYSQSWTMREDNYRLEPYAGDFMIHATILGVQSEVNGLRFYLLDLGTGVAPIALVDDKAPAITVKPWVTAHMPANAPAEEEDPE